MQASNNNHFSYITRGWDKIEEPELEDGVNICTSHYCNIQNLYNINPLLPANDNWA